VLVVIVLVGRERVEGWIAAARGSLVRSATAPGPRIRRVPPRRPQPDGRLKDGSLNDADPGNHRAWKKALRRHPRRENVNLAVEKGARHALIGPNGAARPP